MRTDPPRIRVSGLLIQDGKLLLVRQAKGSTTYWLLPGGGLERGETLAAALAREFREECRLEVEAVEPPVALVEVISPDNGGSRHSVQFVYSVRLLSTALLGPARCDPAVLEVRWTSMEEVDELVLHPPIADLIHGWLDWFQGREPDDLPPFFAAGVRWTH